MSKFKIGDRVEKMGGLQGVVVEVPKGHQVVMSVQWEGLTHPVDELPFFIDRLPRGLKRRA